MRQTETIGSDTNGQVRVLLADDHTLIAQAVGAALAKNGAFTVDTVETFPEALAAIRRGTGYDVVLLDLRMPGVKGLDSVKQAVDLSGDARVALFTANADRHVVMRAIEIGVSGVIPKTMALNSLESVLRLILSGQTFLPQSVMAASGSGSGESDLTDIELLVLKLAAEGMTNKRIANEANLSEPTVKMHMRSICRKLDAQNRAHAAVIARNNGLIDV